MHKKDQEIMKNQENAVIIPSSAAENEKLFNFRPVVFTAIFLCFGIVFAYFHLFYALSWWWLFAFLPVAAVPFFLCRNVKKKSIAMALGVLLLAFVVGFCTFSHTMEKYRACPDYNGEYTVVGEVVEKTEYSYSVKVVLNKVYIDKNRENGKLVAYLPLAFGENVGVADEILLHGSVITETEFFNDYGFRSKDIGGNVRFLLEDATICEITGKSSNIFLRIRARVENILFSGMDTASAGVTLAVLTGNTRLMDDGLLENVRMGGIAHIFAVSGLHVGALYAFCLWLTERTRLHSLKNPVRFLLVAALLVFYASVCGFSSSVMRAMVLCLVAYAAKLIGTESDMLETTGLAAIIVLLIKPTELFAVGFQLSFAACLGIALFARPLREAFERGIATIKRTATRWFRLNERARANPESRLLTNPSSIESRMLQKIIAFSSVSLAAQIATAPILLYSFGFLSLWGVFLNGIFVPFISAVFSILLLFVAVASILPVGISFVVLYLPNLVWSAVLLLFEGVDFSAFAISGVNISVMSALCYYGGWLFLTDKWNMPKMVKGVFAVCCFLAFGVTMYALNL